MEWDGFNVREEVTKAVWEEAVRAVLAMWETEEFSWDGDHIKIPGPRNVIPKPVQKPHPRIWMACTNPDTAREAGQRGVGALLFAHAGLEDIAQRVQLYNDGWADPAGRFSESLNYNVVWATSGLAGKDDRKTIEEYFQYQRPSMGLFARYWPQAVGGTLKVGANVASKQVREEDIDVGGLMSPGGLFIGAPKRIVELLHRAEETGVTQLVIGVSPANVPKDVLARSLELWGEHVLPAFK